MKRPVVLLDVDGPLNPFAAEFWKHNDTSSGYEFHQLNGFKVALNPGHGEQLKWLGQHADLVWATTWEAKANELIAPLIGLPELPVIDLVEHAHFRRRLCWKSERVFQWIGEHGSPPFVWLDDDVSRYDRKAADNDPRVGEHLIRRIEPHVGLTGIDFEVVHDWVRERAAA